ncbi:MAG: formate dehydrogenase accessory sulfurtransferase FdhD [Anaerolineales bacterium]
MIKPKMPVMYLQYSGRDWSPVSTNVIVETPVSLTVNQEVWLTFMCTPIDLEALAIGFLFNEGVIKTMDEVEAYRLCAAGDNVDVWLSHSVEKPEKWRRTSGCTGGVTALEENSDIPAVLNGGMVSPTQVGELVSQLFESQQLYRQAGGVHTSGISDGNSILCVAEDIGRHNTLDKLAGHCLMDGITSSRKIILTTGRISSEMLQKSARMGASILISRTSPSSLSIQLARRLGVTLIGYARRNKFNLYTHPERLLSEISTEISNDLSEIFAD